MVNNVDSIHEKRNQPNLITIHYSRFTLYNECAHVSCNSSIHFSTTFEDSVLFHCYESVQVSLLLHYAQYAI